MEKRARKIRLDALLVERGLAPSSEAARRMIMAGEVWRGTERLTKPGVQFAENVEIEVRSADPYVGRGAHKLLGAIDAFGLDVEGRTAVDLGASTGGFTQVLLERGAARVHAVDVGRGQLAASLRNDARVRVHEGRNAREFDNSTVAEPFDLVVADLSFISLKLVLPIVLRHVEPTATRADAVVLMKPQFEATAAEVGQGGIVRDTAVHRRLLDEFRAWTPADSWRYVADTPSAIRGAQGNQEYLFHYRRG